MSRVSAEISVATAAANSKPKSAKQEPASASDNFSALIDSNASAAASNSERSQAALPDAPAPQRANPEDRNLRNDRAPRSGKDHSTADDKALPASEAADRDQNAVADKPKSADADKPVLSESKPAGSTKEKSSDDAQAPDAEAASDATPATAANAAAAALAATLVVASVAETATPDDAALEGVAEAAPEVGASEAIKTDASATAATALLASAPETAAKTGIAAPVAKGKAATADETTTADDASALSAPSGLLGDGKDLKAGEAPTQTASDKDAAASAKPKAPTTEAVPTAARHEHHTASASAQPSIQTNDFAQPVLNTSQQLLQPNQSQLLPAAQVSVALATNAPVPLSGLAVDIALRAASGKSSFDIRLDPAELGRIDVRLDVDKHGQVTSHLTVEKPATLDMLRRDAPQLQRALEDAGLKTGDNGLQFSLRDQSSFSGRQDDGNSGRQSQRLIISDEDTSLAPIAGKSYGRMLAASRGVDISI